MESKDLDTYIKEGLHSTAHLKRWKEEFADLELGEGVGDFRFLKSKSVNSIANHIYFDQNNFLRRSDNKVYTAVTAFTSYKYLDCEDCQTLEDLEGLPTNPGGISLFHYDASMNSEYDFFNYEEVLAKNNFSVYVKSKIKEYLVNHFKNLAITDDDKMVMPNSLLSLLNFA